ncbi:MAG: copper resistance protein CopD [Gemmatimonadota bacterium]
MEYTVLLFLHVLGACTWTGGYLFLATRLVPAALRRRDPSLLAAFDERFKLLGHAALGVQLLTGFRLAQLHLPMAAWFSLETTASTHIAAKLGLLAATVLLAVHARVRVARPLTPENVGAAAAHAVAIAAVAVLLVMVGLGLRIGGLY